MGKVKNFILDVQEFVWGFFDEDGKMIDGTENVLKVLTAVKKEFNSDFAVTVAKDEIYDIQTADHFSGKGVIQYV
jgi:hypothetical protein